MAELTDYCSYLTGLPKKDINFLVSCKTNYEQVEFYSDAIVYIDWGDGREHKFEAGIIQGTQITGSGYMSITSDETVKEFRFGYAEQYDNNFLEIYIHKAADLTTANRMCYRLEELTSFSYDGTNKITDFAQAWEGCTNLESFSRVYTALATTLYRAWYNCSSLIAFPEIHAPECLTVQSAWNGCSGMLSYGDMTFEKCENYGGAWRGNISLTIFPLMITTAGKDFNHSWAYCTGLKYFPALDFSNAEDMSYMLAYCVNLVSLQTFNVDPNISGKNFTSMLEQCTLLECIGGINTTNSSTTTNMFLECDSLINPESWEISRLTSTEGYAYINSNACYYDAGRSRFYAHCETTGEECTFNVSGGNVFVDWGDGKFIHYKEGTITGIPVFENVINISSEEEITEVHFLSDTYVTVELKRAVDLQTCADMCKDITNLTFFQILGELRYAKVFDRMLMGCTSLEAIDEVDLSYAQSAVSICEGCISLTSIEDRSGITKDISSCTAFDRAFYGCESITTLGTLVTTLGQTFDNMLDGCSNLKCLGGIDTRNQISTTGMFDNCPRLLRPNVNEVPAILSGLLYEMSGLCEVEFNMIFTSNGDITFTTDATTYVDWGTGIYETYFNGGAISGTPVGTVYVYGAITDISFDTDTFVTVDIVNGEALTDMSSIMAGKTQLTSFRIGNSGLVTTWGNAFDGATGLSTFEADNYAYATEFGYMFNNTPSLTDVGNMNTVAGTNFEYMFANTGLVTLYEINTLKGAFPLKWYDCFEPALDCNTLFDCAVPMSCTITYDCAVPMDCYGASTMFESAATTSPNASEQKGITSRCHYTGPGDCS